MPRASSSSSSASSVSWTRNCANAQRTRLLVHINLCKFTAAIPVHHVRKTPHIAQTDGIANARQRELHRCAPIATRLLLLLHHCRVGGRLAAAAASAVCYRQLGHWRHVQCNAEATRWPDTVNNGPIAVFRLVLLVVVLFFCVCMCNVRTLLARTREREREKERRINEVDEM